MKRCSPTPFWLNSSTSRFQRRPAEPLSCRLLPSGGQNTWHLLCAGLPFKGEETQIKSNAQIRLINHASIQLSKVIPYTIFFDMVRSFCVCNINYERNGGGNAFMRKYSYNNHHTEVNLESQGYGVWSSHYDSGNHTVY